MIIITFFCCTCVQPLPVAGFASVYSQTRIDHQSLILLLSLLQLHVVQTEVATVKHDLEQLSNLKKATDADFTRISTELALVGTLSFGIARPCRLQLCSGSLLQHTTSAAD